MSDADASLRLAEVWAFCHARLNEAATTLLAQRDGHHADAETTPYKDIEFGLADIDFKRSQLEEHEPTFPAVSVAACRIDGDTCPFTQRLAALYAGHADYKQSWRP